MGAITRFFGKTDMSLHTHPPSAPTIIFERCQKDQAPNQLTKWQTVYHGLLVTRALTSKQPKETFDQMYEEALSEAFSSRLNVLCEGSFDERFEHHFKGMYKKVIN